MNAFSMSERSDTVRSRTSTTRTAGFAAGDTVDGVLFDLLMAVMDSLAVWAAAAGDAARGLRWRDAVTTRMRQATGYVEYEALVTDGAVRIGLPARATTALTLAWSRMRPWPDAEAVARLPLPYAFVTNCSAALADLAAARSGLAPQFTLSAEAAGAFKPSPSIYREACRRLGTAPERTLFVAGSPYDAVGAHAAGLVSALVVRRPDLVSPDAPVRLLGNLREVVAALGDRARK